MCVCASLRPWELFLYICGPKDRCFSFEFCRCFIRQIFGVFNLLYHENFNVILAYYLFIEDILLFPTEYFTR